MLFMDAFFKCTKAQIFGQLILSIVFVRLNNDYILSIVRNSTAPDMTAHIHNDNILNFSRKNDILCASV